MPIDTAITTSQWYRFQQMRDSGHDKFVKKAETCEAFYRGEQWNRTDAALLKKYGKPVLTINKIKPTINTVRGEQIKLRNETQFRPRTPAVEDVSDALNKVYKQVQDVNQAAWLRSQMFTDGIITSRGFMDIRIDKKQNRNGEIVYTNLNPKNVLIDPDADEYDPDAWADVIVSKWYTADDIAVLFNKKDADLLRNRDSFFPYGFDSIEYVRDRFSDRQSAFYSSNHDQSNVERNIRVIDRQYRKLDKQKMFVEVETGDMRAIPEDFDRNRIAWFTEKFGFQVTTELVRRIRWTVTADNVKLFDDWSPYKHFTVVPYFPGFRYGKTLGMVEDLISPQENLNKIRSQELHVVNSSANGGWKLKTGSLTNMTGEELEEKGAMTGLVLELGDIKDAEKIQPNNTPQGLDRISYKSEEDMKSISGVNDSMQGQDREDVAAKAIQAKKASGNTGLISPLDNLNRTDYIIARNTLDLIQEFYSEPRMIAITGDSSQGTTQFTEVNQVTPEGKIVNDLTMGEYDIIVTSVPIHDTSEDSQFEQAISLKQLGVQIPDSVIIQNSRLNNRAEIIQTMEGNKNSPEAQAAAALQKRGQEAAVAKEEAAVTDTKSKAALNTAKAQLTLKEVHTPPEAPGGADTAGENAKVGHEMQLDERKAGHDENLDMQKLGLEREKMEGELSIKAQAEQTKAEDARIARAQQAAQAAQKPQKPAQ